MSDYQERVVKEKEELEDKILKLEKFRMRRQFEMVNPEERKRLVRQLNAMIEYAGILGERIQNFPQENQP